MANTMVVIDGSMLEGGGQILRNALSLSVLTKTPIKITNIRAGRSKPGLMEQHLKGVELVERISRAKIVGGTLGSTALEFWPGDTQGGHYKSAVRTAGSISLLLQVALPCALFANVETVLDLQGGTNAEMAPQIDYTTEVFRPWLEKMGATFDFDLVRRGYFPKGGGEVAVRVSPVERLLPIDCTENGDVARIYGWSYTAGVLPERVAHGMADGAASVLKSYVRPNIECYKESPDVAPVGTSAGIILVAETSSGCLLGSSALKPRDDAPAEVGRRAATELKDCMNSGACVDKYCQDQLIIYMALASGKSRIKTGPITLHTKSAIYIAELLTKAKFKITEQDGLNIIECDGIGFTRNKDFV